MGTRSLVATFRASLSMTPANLLSDGTKSADVVIGDTYTLDITDGTGSSQADRGWSEYNRALASGANEDLDVFDLGARDIGAGAGLDSLGQAWQIAEISTIMIRNQGPGNLTIDGTISNGWSDIGAPAALAPGGILVLHNPIDGSMPVVDSTKHLINFAAAGGICTYDVHIAARSA